MNNIYYEGQTPNPKHKRIVTESFSSVKIKITWGYIVKKENNTHEKHRIDERMGLQRF